MQYGKRAARVLPSISRKLISIGYIRRVACSASGGITAKALAIVSFSRKFIFIKTRKTAGTSVQESLLPSCAAGDVATMVWRNVICSQRSPIQEFASLTEIEKAFSISRDDFFTFGFTRNPYSLVLSRYLYEIRMGRILAEASSDGFNRWIQGVYFSGEPGFPLGRYIKDRSRLLLFDDMKRQSVDFIGKFEQLDADFAHAIRQICLPARATLVHVNTSNRGAVNYRDWLDPVSRKLIEAHFDFELEFFGYRFGQ